MARTVNPKTAALIAAFVSFLILGVLDLLCAAQPPAEKTDDFWSEYGIIIEGNIFSRYRGRDAVEPRTSSNPTAEQPPPQPESYFVLKGLAKEDDAFVAFFEDTRAGDMIRVRAEEPIARGKITGLTLDSAVYERDANTVSVQVGQTLEGRLASLTLTFENLLEWSQKESAALNTPGDEGMQTPSNEADILKKLMERRRQQIGD
ncbi:MAG: hypothetical protein ACYTBJ_13020 [Planctomycetota bacterium]